MLKRGDFSSDFFLSVHKHLMSGNVRRNSDQIGQYRNFQNYIGTNDGTLVYVPPAPETVPKLMNELINYLNSPSDKYHPLVRTAVVHAQFETVHPFGDGNGRVGRILIPLYLYAQSQISLPYFFISEALEKDQHRYYKLLNDTRNPGKWNEWVKFFLNVIARQCSKYIDIITQVNALYDRHIKEACNLIRSSSSVVKIIDEMYQRPIFDGKLMQRSSDIPLATLNRYLNTLVEAGLLYTDGKKRNRTFFYYDLLSLFRD